MRGTGNTKREEMKRYKDYLEGYAVQNRGGYLFAMFARHRKDLVREIERELNTGTVRESWPEIRKQHGYRIVKARIVVEEVHHEKSDM